MKKYNLELLKEQCGDDKNFYNEMLDIFIRSTQEGIAGIEDAYAKKDMKMLGHYAHKIISPCRHIEAETLIPLLKEMEDKAEQQELSPERAGLLLEQIKKEANQLMEEIKSEISK